MTRGKIRRHFSNNSVIALDQNFIPMMKIDRHHALKRIATGKALILDLATWERKGLDEVDFEMPIRCIVYPDVKAVSNIRMRAGSVGRGILRRDNFVCQYDNCDRKANTVDHVIPRAQGGQSTWGNLVASCLECNQRKGARTPEQAGMVLKGPVKHFRYILYEEFHRLVDEAKVS